MWIELFELFRKNIEHALEQNDIDRVFLLLDAPEWSEIKEFPETQAYLGALYLRLVTTESSLWRNVSDPYGSEYSPLIDVREHLLEERTIDGVVPEIIHFWLKRTCDAASHLNNMEMLPSTIDFLDKCILFCVPKLSEQHTHMLFQRLLECIHSDFLKMHINAGRLPEFLFNIAYHCAFTEKVATTYVQILQEAIDDEFKDPVFFLNLLEIALELIHFPLVIKALKEARNLLVDRDSEYIYVTDILRDTGNLPE